MEFLGFSVSGSRLKPSTVGLRGFQQGKDIFAGADNQRDTAAALIGPGFAEHMVVAKFFSVISGEENN